MKAVPLAPLLGRFGTSSARTVVPTIISCTSLVVDSQKHCLPQGGQAVAHADLIRCYCDHLRSRDRLPSPQQPPPQIEVQQQRDHVGCGEGDRAGGDLGVSAEHSQQEREHDADGG